MERDDFHLKDFLRVIWQNKFLILLVSLAFILASGFYVFRIATPAYGASARLVFATQGQGIPGISSILSGLNVDETKLKTEVAVIRSRGVMEKLVTELHLTEDPEFNPNKGGKKASFSLGNLRAALSALLSPAPPATKQDPAAAAEAELNETVETVLEKISVNSRRDTYLFDISVVTTDPDKSALIANTLARVYLEDQVDAKFASAEYAVSWLTNRVNELTEELQQRKDEVRLARSRSDIADPIQMEQLQLRRLDLRKRIKNARQDIERLDARLAELSALRTDPDPERLSALSDPILDRLLAQPANDERDQAIRGHLETLATSVTETTDRNRDQLDVMTSSLQNYEDRIQAQSTQLDELSKLEFAVTSTQTLYETMLTQLKEASAQLGLQQADGRILSRAIPGELVAPRKAMTVTISALLGMAVGIAAAFLMQQFSNGLRSVDEIARISTSPVLGQIPRIKLRNRAGLIDYIVTRPTSAFMEAVRNLRTSLLLAEMNKPPQIIAITSSIPGEGKTSLSVALTGNLAGVNRRVLIVEGDIRRNSLGSYFSKSTELGLVDVVMGRATLDEAIQHDDRLGIDYLLGGQTDVMAADFFSSKPFRGFLAQIREEYDAVVIDTPPVLLVPDARIIAQHSDALVYCVHWGRALASQVAQGVRELSTVGITISGFALNHINFKQMGQYGYDGYGQYGYGDKSSKSYFE